MQLKVILILISTVEIIIFAPFVFSQYCLQNFKQVNSSETKIWSGNFLEFQNENISHLQIEEDICTFKKLNDKRERSSENEEKTSNVLVPPGKDIKENRRVSLTFWRWLYLDELLPEYQVLVREKTFDERFANTLYTTSNIRMSNVDFYTYNTGDKKQDKLLENMSAGQRVDDKLCGKHLIEMLADMNQLERQVEAKRYNRNDSAQFDDKFYRLARVLDSFGHYESGYFTGRTHSLGSWEQCVGTQLILSHQKSSPRDDERKLVDSRFCWAKLKLNKHLDSGLRQRTKSAFESTSDTFKLGICIPSTCHTRNLNNHMNLKLVQKLVDSQFKRPKSVYVDENLPLESVFCDVDQDSQLYGIPLIGKLFLLAMFAWTMLTIYASQRVRREEVNGEKGTKKIDSILDCLDLRQSWDDFVGTSERQAREGRVNLDTLNPIRWFGCAFVVFGHGLVVIGFLSMDYLRGLNIIETQLFGSLTIIGTFVIDTFFTITGIVLAYVTMKRARRTSRSQNEGEMNPADLNNSKQQQGKKSMMSQFLSGIFKLIQARYLRLLPLYAIVYYFKRTVMLHISSGPFWDYGFNKDTYYGACHHTESWWTPFLFTSAFLPMSRQCLLQSWSISCDIFCTIVIAPILLILTKKPKLAAFMSIVLCAICTYLAMDAFANFDEDDDFIFRDLRPPLLFKIFNDLSYTYTFPHYRTFALVVGMLAGYILFQYDEFEKFTWPKWFKGPATFAAFVYILGKLLCLSHNQELKHLIAPHHMHIYPLFSTFGRLFWSAANAIIFARMVTDWKDNSIMNCFSNRFWQSVSKLSYATMLIHYDLLIWDKSITSTYNATKWSSVQSASNIYLLCIPLSTFLYVTFENPIDKLIRKHVTG